MADGERPAEHGGGAAWPVRSGAVPPLADGCAARAETAADLGAALATGAMVVLVPARVAGEAPGGWLESCGKTQLAVHVAEAQWRSRRTELLVWVTAASRASVLSSYLQAAAETMVTDLRGDGEEVAARFTRWLAGTSRPWLVVLDDLRREADLAGLWPSGPAGRVVITTPNPSVGSGEPRTLVHPVGVFSSEEALAYLMSRPEAGPEPGPGQRQAAADLARELGYEPLALHQASAVMASSGLSHHKYLDCFTARRAQQAEAAGGPPPAASITWAISAEHADQQSGGTARALLRLAALLDGHGIPLDVLTTRAAGEFAAAGTGEAPGAEAAGQAVRALEHAGLLEVDHAQPVPLARMSPVVQEAVRDGLPAELFGPAVIAAADALVEAWPGEDGPAPRTTALRLCAERLRRAAGDLLWPGGCHPLLLRAGEGLDNGRLTGLALAYWNELAAVSDRALGPGHPDTLVVGEHLAQAYLTAGQPAAAIERLGWVLAERVRVLGPDHPSAIAARGHLGHALVAAHQYGEAVTVLDRVAHDYERTLGLSDPRTLRAQDELAAAYQAAGRLADAIRLSVSTLAEREHVQGAEHPDTISTRRRAAAAWLADGNAKNAISQYKRALADIEKARGPGDLDTIAVRAALAGAYHVAGRMAAALQLSEEVRTAYQRALGPDHPDTLASAASLAHVYYDVGRVTDAKAMFRDTLARCERALPPGARLTDTVRRSLANLTGG